MVEKNTAKRVANSGGQPIVIKGTATAQATVPFVFQGASVLSTSVYIANTGATNALDVFVDGSVNSITIPKGEYRVFNMEVSEVELQSVTTTYEILFTF